MRDANRLKEKYDLSLDNRQIVSLVIAGLIVLGAVFVLGLVVGKKLSGNEKTAAEKQQGVWLRHRSFLNKAKTADIDTRVRSTRQIAQQQGVEIRKVRRHRGTTGRLR